MNMLNVGGESLTPKEYQERLRQSAQEITDYGKYQNDINYLQSLLNYKNDHVNADGDIAKQTAAHEKANALLQAAQENGSDLSTIRDNMNANQLAGYLEGLQNESKRRFLYRKTPEQFNAEQIQTNMLNGMDRKKAIEKAYIDTAPYAAQYAAEAKMNFGDRGTTDNAINKVGATLLSLMMNSDPDSTAYLSALYAHPADEWQQDSKLQQMYAQGDIVGALDAMKYANAANLATIRAQNNLDVTNLNNQSRERVATIRGLLGGSSGGGKGNTGSSKTSKSESGAKKSQEYETVGRHFGRLKELLDRMTRKAKKGQDISDDLNEAYGVSKATDNLLYGEEDEDGNLKKDGYFQKSSISHDDFKKMQEDYEALSAKVDRFKDPNYLKQLREQGSVEEHNRFRNPD